DGPHRRADSRRGSRLLGAPGGALRGLPRITRHCQFDHSGTDEIGIALLGMHLVLMLAGFSFCVAGPRGMRSTGVTGIVVVLMHAGLLVPLVIFALGVLTPVASDPTTLTDIAVPHFVFSVSSSVNNLNALTDLPWMIDRGDF